MTHTHNIKTIGSNGQLSLGKEFAGITVLVDHIDNGTWIIKAGEFIPDSESWLYTKKNIAKLDQALVWANTHSPKDNFTTIAKQVESGCAKNIVKRRSKLNTATPATTRKQ